MDPAEPTQPPIQTALPAWIGVTARLLAVAIAAALVLLLALPIAHGQIRPSQRTRPADAQPRIVIATTDAPTTPEPDHAALERTALALGPRFARTRSEHFVVFSDADRQWTDQRVRLLESTVREVRRAMERLGVAWHPPEHALVAILFERREDYQAFAAKHDGVRADWVAGYYATRPNHIVFYHDRTRPDIAAATEVIASWQSEARELRRRAIHARARESAERADTMIEQARALETHATVERRRIEATAERASIAKAIHEAAHQLAFNCGLQSRRHGYPFWLTEGWATNFETEDPDRSFGPDHDHAPRLDSWNEARAAGRLVPFRRFLTITALSTDNAEEASDHYAQAYALYRHLHRTQRQALGRYFADLAAEPPGDIPEQRLLELFIARFGSPEDIEHALMAR